MPTRGALASMALAAFAAALSMTAVSVIVPAIGHEFRLATGAVHWVASGFMAAMLPAMLCTPWLVRRFGVRGAALLALSTLSVGGLCGAMAPSFGLLVAARVLEGMAAGVLQPLPVIVVASRFGAGERGRAMGLVTVGIALAPALGPALAGPVADHLGWRWVLVGPALFSVPAAIAVRWSLSGRTGFEAPQAAPVPALGLFRHRHFRRACLAAMLYGAALFGSAYLVPVFVQEVLHHAAADAGAAMLPAGLALVLCSPWGGRLGDRFERHRLIALGVLLFGVAHLPVLGLVASSALTWLSGWMVVARLGIAVALPSLAVDALQGLASAHWPAASAGLSLCRQTGAALGIAAVSGTVSWRVAAGDPVATAFHAGLWLICGLSLATAWIAWCNAADAEPAFIGHGARLSDG